MSIAPDDMTVTTESSTVAPFDPAAYALALHQAGFNVLPMKPQSKIPDLATWGEFATRRQTEQEVRAWSWGPNLAIINGINNIRTIDIDGCDSADVLFTVLQGLGLDFEYQWIVQSPGKGGGFHIYLICPDSLTLTNKAVLVGDPLPGQEFKQIELRWGRCYTMFPPSIHPDTGTAYHWLTETPTDHMAVVPVQVVESAFLSVAVATSKTRETADQGDQEPKKVVKFDAWALKAQEQELSKVRSAPEGDRNAQLNRSAFALGQIIGSGLLDFEEAQEELTRAALAAGLEENEVAATIKSGLEAGEKKPRMPKQVYKDNEPPFVLPPVKADDEKIASFSADDQGNAEAVYHLYGRYLAFNSSYGWMIWNGTHYVASIYRVNTLIVEVLRRRLRAAAHLERSDLAKVSKPMAGAVAATRAMLETLCFVEVDEFDSEPDLINCLSGVINLRTKALLKHEPTYRFTWCAPVKYNPAASGDLWLDFINATVAAPDMVPYLQEALGYSITGHTSEECLFYIFGPPRSGKGTLSETLLSIFPRPIVSEVDFNTFTAKREADTQNFDLAPLKPARLVFASESNKYQSLNPAKVKALTGGNMVTCAFKHKDTFNYKPQYSVWLSSNHEVNADADDEALWGRVKVVHFPNSRLGKEDKTLKRRMQSPENLEFVLAWLVEGAHRWYQHEGRGLQTPTAVRDLTQKQRFDQDSIGLWLEECCELDASYWTDNNKIRIAYENWCEANGYEAKKANGFARSLSAHRTAYPFLEVGVQQRVTSASGSTEKVRGVRGLRLASS